MWFAQRLREDLAEATELSREHIRVVSVGACQTRAVVELVSESKGVAHSSLLAAAQLLEARVDSRESQMVGGVPVPLFEYVQAVHVSSGHMPPAAPGEWPTVGIFCGSSGADTLPERAVLGRLVVPALSRVLQQHGMRLRCLDLSLHGPRQGSRAHTPLAARLRAMDAHGVEATGSGVTIPIYLGILAGEGSSAQAGAGGPAGKFVLARHACPGQVVAGQGQEGAGNAFDIRAWAGDTSETRGLVRPAGRDRLAMQASVALTPGEYTGSELMLHLAHQLTHAHWTDSTFQPIAKGLGKRNPKRNARGLPMEWLAGIDDKGHTYISCISYTYFRFEMSFKGPALPAFLGFQVDDRWTVRSGELVRQRPSDTEGYAPSAHEPGHQEAIEADVSASDLPRTAAADEASIFVSTLRASIGLQESEERQQCVTHNDFVLQDPWAQMSDGALEVGKACLQQPLARENVLLVRDSGWLYDKMLAVATSNGEIPLSAAHALGFSASGEVPVDPLAGQLIDMALSIGRDALGAALHSYGTAFRRYYWHTLSRVESFERLLSEVSLLRRARGLCRQHSDSKFGSSLKEVVTATNPETGAAGMEGSGMSTDEVWELKMECYKWWRLVRENYDKCIERCPHGMPIQSCVDAECARLVLAACNEELVACDATVRRERQAAGLPNDTLLGHIGASVSGVELDMQDFAEAAFDLVYRAILLRAPARPVAPKMYKPVSVRLVNPVDPLIEDQAAAERREAKDKAARQGRALKSVIGTSCRPLYAHLEERAAQHALQRRLAQGFLMLPGGSRSRCVHELERNSTGPASGLPPVVLLRGPPGSGRTRLLAHFSLHSARCSSERDLVRHMTSSKFASHYSSARQPFHGHAPVPSDAAQATGLPQDASAGLVLVPFFRDASQSLAQVLNYMSSEISLQSTGELEAEGASEGAWANGLLNASFPEMTGAAEGRFLQACTLALARGHSILLICDGLEQEQWMQLAQLVLHVQRHVASQLQSLRFKGLDGEEAGCIQCVLSATTHGGQFGRPAGDGFVQASESEPGAERAPMSEAQFGSKQGNKGVLAQARQVELLELTHAERVAIALHVFAELYLQDVPSGEGSMGGESEAQELAEVIAGKQEAHLALFVVLAATQVALFERLHLRHRQANSYGEVPRSGAVLEFSIALPPSLSALWSDFLLPKLEGLVDYLTVQWVMLVLLNHPEGLSRQLLQSSVRAVLDGLHWRQETVKGVKGAMQRILVVGPHHQPSYILDVDSQAVLWDHRIHKDKAAVPIIKSLQPYEGRLWCTDQELHVILSHLRPVLRPGGSACWGGEAGESKSVLADEWDNAVTLDHEKLRVEALFRYDNPGSITVQQVKPVVPPATKGASKSDAPVQELLLAHLDAHSVHGYPSVKDVRLSGWSGAPHVPQLQMHYMTAGCKVNARVAGAVKVGANADISAMQLAGITEENMSEDLTYVHSALNSHEVSSFFKSLDDNCVWHLYHFDEVLALFPGMAISRAKFRPRVSRKSKLLSRFPQDKHLLFLGDGTVRRDGKAETKSAANDRARRGQSLALEGVRQVVQDSEHCMEIAHDASIDAHVDGQYELEEADADGIPIYRCNYSGATSDLRTALAPGAFTGYAVSLDVHLDPECFADQFLLTGGTGAAKQSDLNAIRRRMSPAFDEDEEGEKSLKAGHFEWNGRILACRSRFPVAHAPVEELVDVATGMAVWKMGRPWFALRYGHAYVMLLHNVSQMHRTAGRGVLELVTKFFGTIHNRPNDVDDIMEAHFFDVYDYVNARAALRETGLHFEERHAVDEQLVGGLGGLRATSATPTAGHPELDPQEADGPPDKQAPGKVLSVWVQGAYVSDAARFPAASESVFWTGSWELPVGCAPDLPGAWHALAVSVSGADGMVSCYVNGEMLPACRLPEQASLYVNPDDAKFALSNAFSLGGVSGHMKNLAIYSRPLAVMEAQTMTTRLPTAHIPVAQEPKTAAVTAQEEEEEEGDKGETSSVDAYSMMVSMCEPAGYWPMQEPDGDTCSDKAYFTSAGVDDGGGGKKGNEVTRDMRFESRFADALIKGDVGPERVGGVSICLQGGTIRGPAGSMCRVPQGAATPAIRAAPPSSHELPDLTLEVWIRRTQEILNTRETILSIDSEDRSLPKALTWFLTSTGHVDVEMSGLERTVGPCPVGAVADLQWHHMAVTRTSDKAVVNNWTFFLDGQAVWSTRHEGVPTLHALATPLLGKRHGEHWGPKRDWRPGVGDKTCLQGNICHFALYYTALEEDRIAERFAGTALPAAVDDMLRLTPSASLDAKPPARENTPAAGRSVLQRQAAAGTQEQLVARSVISARLHQPRVWGRSGPPTSFDVESFYRDLEKNPVFAITRRAFVGGSGQSREVMFGTSPPARFAANVSGGGQYTVAGSTVRTAPSGTGGPVMLGASSASWAPRNKVEAAHAAAALALCRMADPGDVGVWERLTPHLTWALPRHYLYARHWQQLSALLCNLCFLTRCLRLHPVARHWSSVASLPGRVHAHCPCCVHPASNLF